MHWESPEDRNPDTDANIYLTEESVKGTPVSVVPECTCRTTVRLTYFYTNIDFDRHARDG